MPKGIGTIYYTNGDKCRINWDHGQMKNGAVGVYTWEDGVSAPVVYEKQDLKFKEYYLLYP